MMRSLVSFYARPARAALTTLAATARCSRPFPGGLLVYRFISALAMAGAFLLAAPVRAAPPIEAYGKLPAIEQVSLSPSG
jgi:hypothetical protein